MAISINFNPSMRCIYNAYGVTSLPSLKIYNFFIDLVAAVCHHGVVGHLLQFSDKGCPSACSVMALGSSSTRLQIYNLYNKITHLFVFIDYYKIILGSTWRGRNFVTSS